jgi:hypothetical protein
MTGYEASQDGDKIQLPQNSEKHIDINEQKRIVF